MARLGFLARALARLISNMASRAEAQARLGLTSRFFKMARLGSISAQSTSNWYTQGIRYEWPKVMPRPLYGRDISFLLTQIHPGPSSHFDPNLGPPNNRPRDLASLRVRGTRILSNY